ncbi:molybdate ABC transporter periplasmic molybdate-binding protein [compost metagenome]
MRRLPLLLLSLFLPLLPAVSQATPDVLRVASGSQIMRTLEPLVDQYQMETGNKVLLIDGPSDQMADEIAQGALYDMYFADDSAGPQKLHAMGRGETPHTYACRQQYVVLVEGPRHELAERFIEYFDAHGEMLTKAGYHLPEQASCTH